MNQATLPYTLTHCVLLWLIGLNSIHAFTLNHFGLITRYFHSTINLLTIIVAVTEESVREEHFLHDLCLLGAVTAEITQILTRAGFT